MPSLPSVLPSLWEGWLLLKRNTLKQNSSSTQPRLHQNSHSAATLLPSPRSPSTDHGLILDSSLFYPPQRQEILGIDFPKCLSISPSSHVPTAISLMTKASPGRFEAGRKGCKRIPSLGFSREHKTNSMERTVIWKLPFPTVHNWGWTGHVEVGFINNQGHTEFPCPSRTCDLPAQPEPWGCGRRVSGGEDKG